MGRESVEARAWQALQEVSVENIQSFMKNAARSLFRSGDRGSTNWQMIVGNIGWRIRRRTS